MQAWQQFYELIGGAAATLLGLLFVSVSLNAEVILSQAHQHSRTLAEQAFQNYVAILVVSLLVVMPDFGHESLGYSLLSMSALWGVWAMVRLHSAIRYALATASWRSPLRRYVTTLSGFGMLVFAAYRMIFGGDYTAYVAAGSIVLLVSATVASWELLIKVAQERYGDPAEKS